MSEMTASTKRRAPRAAHQRAAALLLRSSRPQEQQPARHDRTGEGAAASGLSSLPAFHGADVVVARVVCELGESEMFGQWGRYKPNLRR
jgi:hypothetical protein